MNTVQSPTSKRHRRETGQGLTTAGNCHRVAVAVENLDDTLATWRQVFGFGLMLDPVYDEQDKSAMGILWAGNMPLLALGATDADGTIGRYLRRNGPSVQSLAWEIDDMWGTDHRLRANDITVTGVHIEGRHFFMHPRNTFGLLLEFTDDRLPHDPRAGDDAPTTTEPIITVEGIESVTAVVPLLDPVIEKFRLIFGVEPTLVSGPEGAGSADRIVVYRLGDLNFRVVEPSGDASPYAPSLRAGSGRLHSVALAVSNFAGLDDDLERAGLRALARSEGQVTINPDDMHGIRFELVPASGEPSP